MQEHTVQHFTAGWIAWLAVALVATAAAAFIGWSLVWLLALAD
jgi:hypothetical protein